MKLNVNKALFKNTIIYTITDALGKAVAFILLPFISMFLSPEELGFAANYTVLTTAISLLAGLAIVNSLIYLYYERTREANNLLVSNLIILTFLACGILLLLILFFNSPIFQYTKLNLHFQLLSVLYVVTSVFSNLDLQLYRLEEKPKQFAILQIIQILTSCILVILFVIILKKEGEGKIYADTTTVFIIGLVHMCLLKKRGYLSLKFDKNSFCELLKFGLPLMPHSISFWLRGSTQKLFITNFVGLGGNGIYSLALSISSIYSMVSGAFFNAYEPALQQRLNKSSKKLDNSEKITIVKLQYTLFLLLFVVALFAIVGAWVIINYLIDDKYRESFIYIPGIITSLFICAIYNFSTQFIYTMKKTSQLGIITFTGSILQMILSYFFIKLLGLTGAVISGILGSLIISVVIFYYSNKVYPLPWLFFFNRNKKMI